MDIFSHYSREVNSSQDDGRSFQYFIHTHNGKMLPIFTLSVSADGTDVTFKVAPRWTLLCDVLGYNFLYPTSICTNDEVIRLVNEIITTPGWFLQQYDVQYDFRRYHCTMKFNLNCTSFLIFFFYNITNTIYLYLYLACWKFEPPSHFPDVHYHSPTRSTITWFVVKVWRNIEPQIPLCMQQHLIEHVYFTAQLLHGNNAPWEVYVEGLRFTTGWQQFVHAFHIQHDDYIVFRHIGVFKFQFFIFRNRERVTILDAEGDGIERFPPSDMLHRICINTKSSIPGNFGLDILAECRALLVTADDLIADPGLLLTFIYNTESEDEGVDVIHGDKQVHFHSRELNYGEAFEHLKLIILENVLWDSLTYVFFNLQPRTIYALIFDRCGTERISDHLFSFTISDSVYLHDDWE